jgi:hypothetical protein
VRRGRPAPHTAASRHERRERRQRAGAAITVKSAENKTAIDQSRRISASAGPDRAAVVRSHIEILEYNSGDVDAKVRGLEKDTSRAVHIRIRQFAVSAAGRDKESKAKHLPPLRGPLAA